MTTPRRISYIDTARPIKASNGFAGAGERRLDALVWEPPAGPGSLPLVIYCHGTAGAADNASYLAEALAAAGYLVVAPDFPLTSLAAFTRIAAADISDAGEQVRDIAFLIDSLLADPVLGPRIDPRRIATIGHSLGAITCWFASFGARTRDPRIVATVLLGAGDPVVASQATDIGLAAAGHDPAAVPALLVTAEKDLFALLMGPHGTAWPRLSAPKFEVMIAGAAHVWFHDGDAWPADHSNPDSLWFEQYNPGFVVPGSEQRVPLIGPARQRAITLAAVSAFLAAALDGAAGWSALLALPDRFAEVTLHAAP